MAASLLPHDESQYFSSDIFERQIATHGTSILDQYLPAPFWVAFVYVRLRTFPRKIPCTRATEFAKNGFIYRDNKHIACVYCGFTNKFDHKKPGLGSIQLNHFRKQPECATFDPDRNAINNIHDMETLVCWKILYLRKNVHDTRKGVTNKAYHSLEHRLASFKNCNYEEMEIRHKEYADNGFFYLSSGIIQCYYCGVCLYNLAGNGGIAFYDKVPYLHVLYSRGCMHREFTEPQSVYLAMIHDFSLLRKILMINFEGARVQACNDLSARLGKLEVQRLTEVHTNINVSELKLPLETVEPLTDTKDQQLPVIKDNMCCVCFTNSADVLFYPCMHLVCCKSCTLHLDDRICVVCRLPIRSCYMVHYA